MNTIRNILRNSVKMSSESGKALEKLREFGYAFNDAGELRQIDKGTGELTDKPFEFEVFKDHAKNQEHYEKLADQVPEIVYDLLEKAGLSRSYVPDDIPKEEATFVFTRPESLSKSAKLLVLIHGSGFVRAGQWARSLIINNSIDHGTQIPYIKRAESLGYDVLVTNTNDNHRVVDGKRQAIPKSGTPSQHAKYVWQKYVIDTQPESVAIVAHSYGGAITLDLAASYPDFFKEKVFAVAFTDSAHYGIDKKVINVLGDKTCNWVSSSEPLDTPIKSQKGDIAHVSAGHPKHEWSSYAAFESVFTYLEKQYDKFTGETSRKKSKSS